MNETNQTAKVPHVRKPERVGYLRRLFGPSKAELQGIAQERADWADRQGKRARAAEELAERFQKLFEALEAERNVSWPKPAARLSPKQVMAEFDLPIDTGILAALFQKFDEELQELLDRVSQPPSATLTAETRLHIAGGIEHLRLFQKDLLDLCNRASTSDPDLQEDKKATKK